MAAKRSDPTIPTSLPPAAPKRADNTVGEISLFISQIGVEQRHVNLGQDLKFEDDPFNARLNGLMKSEEYRAAIGKINERLKECRSKTLDLFLLMSGPLMIPLIPWAIRHKINRKKRREIMEQCVSDFNEDHPHLYMRWQRRPQKELIIMSRAAADKLLE